MFLEETGAESDENGEIDSCKFFVEGPRSFGETIQNICKGVFGGSICSSIASVSKKASISLGKGSTKFLEENERDGEISSEERLKHLGLQPISIRHLRAMAIEVHKKLAGLSALDDGLVSRIAHSRTRAGSRGDLLLPATRKDNFKYSFTAVGPRVFNLLSVETRNAESTSEFKRGFDSDVTNFELVVRKIFS